MLGGQGQHEMRNLSDTSAHDWPQELNPKPFDIDFSNTLE